jgi:uncharacterized RDD family membrane protein YckC
LYNTPANYGKRAFAYIIDFCCVIGIGLAFGMVGLFLLIPSFSRTLGIIVLILSPIAMFLFEIWNKIIRQGSTGQTIGKKSQNIRIINSDTNAIPGIGSIFLREFLFYIFNALTGGIFLIVDYLFPVWEPNGKRIMDKMLKTQVVDSGQSIPSAPLQYKNFDPPAAV